MQVTVCSLYDINKLHGDILALIDYVSRVHEIAMFPSSVVRLRPSVCVAIISELYARISFKI